MQISYEHRLIERFQRGEHKTMDLLVDHNINGLLRFVMIFARPRQHVPVVCKVISHLADDFVSQQPS
jgi:hypothetical protein